LQVYIFVVLFTLPCSIPYTLAMESLRHFDNVLTIRIQALPYKFKPFMRAATLCGSAIPVIIILLLQYELAGQNIKRAVIFIALAILINTVLKELLHRPRPHTPYVTLMRFKTYSFPSGHAFGSTTTYGLLAYQALLGIASPWNFLAALFITIIIIAIGVSRIYLGAHYPSDVLGGWLLGSACLVAAILIA
jgi:undecaprenyl-diphosphatase